VPQQTGPTSTSEQLAGLFSSACVAGAATAVDACGALLRAVPAGVFLSQSVQPHIIGSKGLL
jgi:hypothetical protein